MAHSSQLNLAVFLCGWLHKACLVTLCHYKLQYYVNLNFTCTVVSQWNRMPLCQLTLQTTTRVVWSI